jgi:hypothetical protein
LDDCGLAHRPLGRPGLPGLEPLRAKRRLAGDLLRFCRLSEEDGKGTKGWLGHLRKLSRRSARLTKLGLTRLELRGPGTELDVGLVSGTQWLGGPETLADGRRFAPNMPTEETFTSPDPRATSGTFRCTFPLSFRGRLIHGLRGEFSSGRLVRLEADSDEDRDFVAAYIDTDRMGRRLGEVALVDSSSRIGETGRIYYNTLLDENAAAHIAFGSGFGGTRSETPARGINRSVIHLDVMIGSPELEATGFDARGRRIPLIYEGPGRSEGDRHPGVGAVAACSQRDAAAARSPHHHRASAAGPPKCTLSAKQRRVIRRANRMIVQMHRLDEPLKTVHEHGPDEARAAPQPLPALDRSAAGGRSRPAHPQGEERSRPLPRLLRRPRGHRAECSDEARRIALQTGLLEPGEERR